MIIPLTDGFYDTDSPFARKTCVNWFVHNAESGALSSACLRRTPGLTQLATAGSYDKINRGAWSLKGKAYFVQGDTLYRLESDLSTLTNLGAISGSGRVSMADNGTQLFIQVPGGNGYIFTDSPDTLTQITDTDFTANGAPQYVVFIDGYFVLTTDSKKFICSALNDGLSYDALDFGSAEANPDAIVAPFVFKNQLFIAGTETIEAFQNIGGSGFPFQRSGLYLSKGCVCPLSFAATDETFVWIGAGKNEKPAIYAFNGGGTQRLSTSAIESKLSELSTTQLSQVASISYSDSGHQFVGFTLPTTSIFFDFSSGTWHERKSVYGDEVSRHRVQSLVTAYNKVLVGDAFDGRVGQMDSDYLDDYGTEIRREFVTQPFQNETRAFFLPSIEITCKNGAGNGSVEDPQIGLELSRDGGRNYSDKRLRSVGKVGEYKKRAIWRRNGRVSNNCMFRVTLSDAVDTEILQITADIL